MGKTCSFFGHRNVKKTEELKSRVRAAVVELIENHDVCNFLFGSKSAFDDLCHEVVTSLQPLYPQIRRKNYPCRSETCALVTEREYWEKLYAELKTKSALRFFEEEVDHKNKYVSGRAQYVERNQAMIDDSDYCIFYYDALYEPEKRKRAASDLTEYQPNSGTERILEYARVKKRNGKLLGIFNVFQEE